MKTEKPLLEYIARPHRDPDYISERGVEYFWAPDWLRNAGGTIGRIKVIKRTNASDSEVDLYMISKYGNATFIRGRIQKAFKKWHEDRQIDYLLLGTDPEEDLKVNW